MKSMLGGKSLLRTTTMAQVPVHHVACDELKERVINALTLLAIVAAIVAVYGAMFVALYRWSHYAPIFPPDGAAAPAITQPLE